jgi:hypothetical protein
VGAPEGLVELRDEGTVLQHSGEVVGAVARLAPPVARPPRRRASRAVVAPGTPRHQTLAGAVVHRQDGVGGEARRVGGGDEAADGAQVAEAGGGVAEALRGEQAAHVGGELGGVELAAVGGLRDEPARVWSGSGALRAAAGHAREPCRAGAGPGRGRPHVAGGEVGPPCEVPCSVRLVLLEDGVDGAGDRGANREGVSAGECTCRL